MSRSIWLMAICASLAVHADEGMWTFDNPPVDQVRQAYGFAPDSQWLDHVRLSTLEFGSGSGAFVSKDGLVITNHHIGRPYIEKVSSPGDKDYVRNGFIAKSRSEEIRIPDLKLYTLVKTVDVTDKVNAAVKPGMDDKQATTARMEKLTKLRDDFDQQDGLLGEWVILHRGGEYWLYGYKVHRDVRLVMAPEEQIAFFGGDPDNFTFPRHDMDFALFRVYEGGVPSHPAHFLRWGTAGVRAGEPVFVAGKPGHSDRYATLAQLRYIRDVELPMRIAHDEAHRAALIEFGKDSEAHRAMASRSLFTTENNLKRAKGELAGLLDPSIYAQLQQKEESLRENVAKEPRLQAEAGQSWSRIEETLERQKASAKYGSLVNSRNSGLLATALDIVRCAQELDKAPAGRLEGYRTLDDEDYQKWRLGKTIAFDDPELDTFLITKGLEDIERLLEPSDAFRRAVLGDRSPAEVAREAVAGTRIQAQYIRRDLVQGRGKAVSKSSDPLVKLAKAIETFACAADQNEQACRAIIRDQTGRIARVRFAVSGKHLYPDATGTIRLSYGSVEGYEEAGRQVQPFTTFAEMYEKARKNGPDQANGAWALPARWQDRQQGIALDTPLNFCSTADIVGGNSGSPTINAKGEFVGLIFDGNLQSLPGDFFYDKAVNRAISVDARAIVESLIKVYGAEPLANELLSR